MKLKNKNIFGFTLVELLVVISIIGILTMIGAVAFSGAQKKARDTQRKTELAAVSNALLMYYNDMGYFPEVTSFDALFDDDVGFTGPGEIVYMKGKPVDPKDDGESDSEYQYVYKYLNDPKMFNLFTNLENKSDSSCDKIWSIVDINSFCYGISSPNLTLRNWD